jgi:predicted Zn-dependent protease
MLLLFLTLLLFACDKLPKLGAADDASNKLATASQDDCGFVQNSYGQRVSWKQSLPVKIYLDPTFPSQYDSVLRDAAKRWEDVVGRTLFVFERTSGVTTATRDGLNVAYFESPWNGGDSRLQAVSTLNWYNNQLTETDLRVNSQNFTYYTTTPNSNYDVHLPSLLVHELGHVLGLKHVSGTSVMVTTLDYLLKRDLPTEEDKAHIRCEYN